MTKRDDDIREELDRKVREAWGEDRPEPELEPPGTRAVEVDSPPGGPPLLFLSPTKLSQEALYRLRHCVREAWQRGGPGPRMLCVDGHFKVFQLVEGEWRAL